MKDFLFDLSKYLFIWCIGFYAGYCRAGSKQESVSVKEKSVVAASAITQTAIVSQEKQESTGHNIVYVEKVFNRDGGLSRSIYRATADSASEAISDSHAASNSSEYYSKKRDRSYEMSQNQKKNFMVGIYTDYNDLTQNNFDNIHAQVGYRLFSDFYGVFQFNRDFTESKIGFAVLF